MNNKLLIKGIGLIILIIVSYYFLTKAQTPVSQLVKNTIENASSKCSGLEGKKLEQCLAKADEQITSIAVNYNDPSVCENTSISNVEGIGRQECYTRVAIALENASICKNIGEENFVNSCYEEVAIKTNDSSACSLIADSMNRDECYSSYASMTGDKNACDFITDDLTREQCSSL